MQLEFKPANIIQRLTKFQSVLGQGQVINANKLQDKIGYDLEHNKN